MGKIATNISLVLGLATIAFAGYYLYTQKSATTLNFESNQVALDGVIAKTAVFIEHRQTLDKITLDLSVLEDKRFTTLHTFSTKILNRPIGRPNPFAEPGLPLNTVGAEVDS